MIPLSLTTNSMDIALLDASRLGHQMSPWLYLNDIKKYHSYCARCPDFIVASSVKAFSEPQVAGPALVLRCK